MTQKSTHGTEGDGKSFEEMAYELPEIWEYDWFSEDDRVRIHDVADLIPPGTTSLVDVGCGNGLFINYVKERDGRKFDRLVGVDRSAVALSHVKAEKYLVRIDSLPFCDREFDTVTCMEVLEHLPTTVFPRALAELSRIARKHIMISVPYRQDLEASLSVCPNCCARFNADFHVRSFDEAGLGSLLQRHGFHQINMVFFNESLIYPDQELRRRVGKYLRPQKPPIMPSYAICPVCGFHDQTRLQQDLAAKRTSAKTVGLNAGFGNPPRSTLLRSLLSKMFRGRKRYHWMCAIYERTE